jgi:5-formyltetrahydrofolate cyclo-ligase
MHKLELRREFLEKRKKLTDEEARLLSRQIADQFIDSFKLGQVQYLHVYLPLPRQREIDTFLLVKQVQTRYPHVQVLVPKADPATMAMESYLFDERTELAISDWGIPEPARGTLVAPEMIDLIVVPLLAFDQQGYRVGYGKGFYDRYLARCRPAVSKVGLSCFEPVAEITDSGPYDVRLDYCVTPGKVWAFPDGHPA